MSLIDHHQVLKGLTVQDAMRRQVIQLPAAALLSQAIRAMIKFKVNAILVTGQAQEPLGVVSKTDLMTAYYGGLPLETPVAGIMVGPPQFCQPQDSLDAALDQMREHGIHRVICHWRGNRNRHRGFGLSGHRRPALPLLSSLRSESAPAARSRTTSQWRDQFYVREVMTPSVTFFCRKRQLMGCHGGTGSV